MRRAICLVAAVLVAFCVRADGQSIAPKRPQTPVPPYPYAQREISYTNGSDGTRISGTLTIPARTGLE